MLYCWEESVEGILGVASDGEIWKHYFFAARKNQSEGHRYVLSPSAKSENVSALMFLLHDPRYSLVGTSRHERPPLT